MKLPSNLFTLRASNDDSNVDKGDICKKKKKYFHEFAV